MERPDLVTIVVTVFNKELFVQQCIDSVLAQTYTNLELIVIDDGSTDASGSIIESISDHRVRRIVQDNSGVCHARNRGLVNAEGQWILFLDGDDWLDPHHLETLLTSNVENTDLMVSGWITVDEGSSGKVQEYKSKKVAEHELLAGSPWILHAALIRRQFLIDHGLRFSADLNRLSCEDNRFWFEVCRNATLQLVDYPGAYYRVNVVDSRTLPEDCTSWVEGFIQSTRLNLGDVEQAGPDHFVVLVGSIENVIEERGARIDESRLRQLKALCSLPRAILSKQYVSDARDGH